MCNRTTSTKTGGARRRPLRAGVIAGLVALFSIAIPVFIAADDSLPSRKQVLLLSASLWESYRWHIVAVVGLIGAQGVLIGALLLQHRRRRRAETVVRERLDFETLVSDLSATFVGLRGAEVDEGIARGLRRVGEHLGLDRVLILELAADDQAIRLTHAWTAPGVPAPPSLTHLDRFPWSMEHMRRIEVVRFSTLDQLPEVARVDRETFASLGVKSTLGIPLAAAGAAMGVLTLSTLRRAQEWSDDLVQRLEFVGGIFSSALLRQRGEIELRKLRRDLTHVGRVATMGELTASIAHELTQPLTAILSNARVAERLIDSGVDAKDLREIVSDIVADDKRAIDVIDRLRAFFKKDDTNQRPLDVNVLIQDVVGLVRSDATTRGVSIDLELAAGLPVVLADRVQLQQVVLNLIMNGLDAMRTSDDRRLAIATHVGADGVVRVSVSDRGTGIAEGELPLVFDPFHTTKPQGLGMGLSIARSLVEAHGGRLWAKNNSNGGATFTFTLPLSKERPSSSG
jgi:signal transduction histidine kinase